MSPKNVSIASLLFFVVFVLLDTYAVGTVNQAMEQWCKPFLMPSLALWFVMIAKKKNIWYLLALFFSFLGDVFLLFDEYFLFGVACFLVTHVFFVLIISRFIQEKSFGIFAKFSIPFLLFFSFIVALIYPNLEDFLVPVIIYGLVIASFGTVVLINFMQEKTNTNLLLLIGALNFILSDSFIAINKFYVQNTLFSILVIALYCVAQFIICNSLMNKFDGTS